MPRIRKAVIAAMHEAKVALLKMAHSELMSTGCIERMIDDGNGTGMLKFTIGNNVPCLLKFNRMMDDKEIWMHVWYNIKHERFDEFRADITYDYPEDAFKLADAYAWNILEVGAGYKQYPHISEKVLMLQDVIEPILSSDAMIKK